MPDIRSVQADRYAFMRTGRSYLEWRIMARWQRADFLFRHVQETKERVKVAQKGFGGLIGAIVAKFLGV